MSGDDRAAEAPAEPASAGPRLSKTRQAWSKVRKEVYLKPEYAEKARHAGNRGRFYASRARFERDRAKAAAAGATAVLRRPLRKKETASLRQGLAGLRNAIRTSSARRVIAESSKPVWRPDWLTKRLKEPTRTSQWIAALLLPMVIVVTLPLIVAVSEVLTGIMLNGGDVGDQLAIFQFLITGINLGLFIFGAWFWFQWVRSGGLGYFVF